MRKGRKLPPGLQLPVKPGIVNGIITEGNPSVQVWVHQKKHQAFFKEDRDVLKKEGKYHLMDCTYYPLGGFAREVPFVSAALYGIPTSVWSKSGVNSEQLLGILREFMRLVSERDAWSERWWLKTVWCENSSMIEYSLGMNLQTSREYSETRRIYVTR